MTHGGTPDEVDFKDLQDQINEYEKALGERLEAYQMGKSCQGHQYLIVNHI